MSGESNDPSVFDVDKVRELVELMHEHELNEIELRQDDRRIKLRKGAEAVPAMMGYPTAPMPQTAAPAPAAATGGNEAPVVDESNFDFIKSPAVGTFYDKPKPDAATFVKVGDVVQADTVVCLIEAMKMFSEIQAGISGKIVACLVENESAVDVNKPLFKVEPL